MGNFSIPVVYGNIAMPCAKKGCDLNAVKGSRYCLVHIPSRVSFEDELRECSPGFVKIPPIGWVYFVAADGAPDQVKIGKAKNLTARIISLQTGCPTEIKCLASFQCRNYAQMEKEIHKRLAGDRMKGEWFRMTETVERVVNEARERGESGVRAVLGIRNLDCRYL